MLMVYDRYGRASKPVIRDLRVRRGKCIHIVKLITDIRSMCFFSVIGIYPTETSRD
jgi:hypothetical protein